ncbi:MAG: CPCC family cysteine-rich protein [Clostridia bacterium]
MSNNMRIKKCAICDNNIFVDEFDNGRCDVCGWEQSIDSLDFPDEVRYPNRITYKEAMQIFKEQKRLIPTFKDFIEMFNFYSEVEFCYQNKNYGVIASDGATIEFYEMNVPESLQLFASISQFETEASINGKLLKDIWEDVYKAAYMGCVEDY